MATGQESSGGLQAMTKSGPSVSVTYARTGASTKENEFGMRDMQKRVNERKDEILKRIRCCFK